MGEILKSLQKITIDSVREKCIANYERIQNESPDWKVAEIERNGYTVNGLIDDLIYCLENEITADARHHGILKFELPSGEIKVIRGVELDFFNKIVALPAETKIELMGLTETIIEQHGQKLKRKRYKDEQSTAIENLALKWYWRDTGEPAKLDADVFKHEIDIELSQLQLLNRAKKGELNVDELKKINKFLIGDGSPLYTK